ncbi:hypothetical protein ACFPZ0_14520 [Streptomonospora nanhaiensis]|uniref:hypothetical protein n=1 Tax=Streptomonospora nanhaiensis TaxID=1323731 RepID=UPI001C992496|nr:hypothetical protein [Streptomonospora nanhaiensis]MBX9390606.1 hypothetical protein [Streptomonospora nanhaiensis]
MEPEVHPDQLVMEGVEDLAAGQRRAADLDTELDRMIDQAAYAAGLAARRLEREQAERQEEERYQRERAHDIDTDRLAREEAARRALEEREAERAAREAAEAQLIEWDGPEVEIEL